MQFLHLQKTLPLTEMVLHAESVEEQEDLNTTTSSTEEQEEEQIYATSSPFVETATVEPELEEESGASQDMTS